MNITYLNGGTPDHIGLILSNLTFFANPEDDAKKQLHDSYPHGGGWIEVSGFSLREDNSLLATLHSSPAPCLNSDLSTKLLSSTILPLLL